LEAELEVIDNENARMDEEFWRWEQQRALDDISSSLDDISSSLENLDRRLRYGY
jgi:hypothetical protein